VSTSTVTWRQTVAAIAAAVFGLLAVTVVFNSDGLPAVNAASSRATHWFVDRQSDAVVLADGYGGRALARVPAGAGGAQISVSEGASGAYLVNDATAEVQEIETAELSFGAPTSLSALAAGQAISAVGPTGLTVVNPLDGKATFLSLAGEPLTFDVPIGGTTVVGPDGVVWTIDGAVLRRTTSNDSVGTDLGIGPSALIAVVGNDPFIVDPANSRARLGDGPWQLLDTTADASELVIQQDGPSADCGWVGANDDLWCVSADGIDERSTIPGLDIDGSDYLAIAGDAAVAVRRGPASIVRFDWRSETIIQDETVTVAADEPLVVTSTIDLIWIDEEAGNRLWAVNPWALNAIDKNSADVFVVGDDGQAGSQDDDPGTSPSTEESTPGDLLFREPDDNDVDDPPVAVDDPTTARSGSSVSVQVTANDYDPDGEAIAVQSVGTPGHGTVEIGTASTVVYTPDSGYVGIDTFEYSIVDGDGTEVFADVIIELLPADAANKPPIGSPDEAQTGPGAPVVVEVLLNDVDPERDSLRIGSFTSADGADATTIGEVTETEGLSGLPALRYVPAPGFEGTALFSYRPVDSLDGQGDDVEVRVEVADTADGNRPPVARPDAVRARRNIKTPLLVLVNDIDPDGDDLTLSVVSPLPDGLEVVAEGAQLSIVARAGARQLMAFQYEIADGRGGVTRGSVLVDVIDDAEPNLPPVLTADTDTVVVGSAVRVDVLVNDSDPDGDPLVLVDVSQPDDQLGQAVIVGDRVQFTPGSIGNRDETNARFTYTVSDGHDHEVTGDVSVSVLKESIERPPWARDDSTFTLVDSPVTVDVLRNDGDPSGGSLSVVGTPGCPAGGRAVVTADGQVRFDPPAKQAGAFRCSYEVANSQGLSATASIVISVREPLRTNEPPVAGIDNLTVEVGAVGVADLTGNDSDPDGDSSKLTVVSSTAPTLGAAVRRNNSITFTAGTTIGVTTINYQVADAEGGLTTGRLVVRIIDKVNRPPVASTDQRTIYGPGVATTFDVLDGDSDPDDPAAVLTVQSATLVSGEGSVSLAGRIVTITPNPSFVGNVVATYTIADSGGLTATAQAILTVLKPLNRPPIAKDDSNDVANGASVNTAVLFNDSDPDGDPLAISLTSAPDSSLGTARLNSDRTIGFSSVPGASGVASVGYQITDGEFTTNATLRITVRPCSESQPVASNGFLRTGYQQPIGVDLNVFGSNGNIVDVVGPPGFVDGLYTPPAGQNGNVAITYTVVNGCRLRASGTVTIDVNQDPIPQAQTVTLGRLEVREIPVGNMATDAEALTIVSSTGAPSWVVTEAGRLVLQPPAGTPLGTVNWTTVVRDPGGLTANVAFSVTVTNRAPIGVADTVDVSGGPATAQVLDNDTDPDSPNSDLRVTGVSTSVLTFPEGGTGTVTIVGGRNVRIDPQDGRGTVNFTYTLSDGVANAGPVAVTVIGAPLNTPPYANDQTVNVVSGEPTEFRLDAGDADGEVLQIIGVFDPDGLWTSIDDLNVTITAPAPGSYVITYQANDFKASSRVAKITINAT
jgi:large repetitive protein